MPLSHTEVCRLGGLASAAARRHTTDQIVADLHATAVAGTWVPLSVIGARHGVTRQRVQQVAKAAGITLPERQKFAPQHHPLPPQRRREIAAAAARVRWDRTAAERTAVRRFAAPQPRRRDRSLPALTCWPYLSAARTATEIVLVAIASVIPRHLPEPIRAEVGQELAIAVHVGEIGSSITELTAAVGPVTAKVRQTHPLRRNVSLAGKEL